MHVAKPDDLSLIPGSLREEVGTDSSKLTSDLYMISFPHVLCGDEWMDGEEF